MTKKQIKNITIIQSIDDTSDIPDCFGEFDKSDKVCLKHCSVSLKCISEKIINPKIDILDRLINLEYYPLKPQ